MQDEIKVSPEVALRASLLSQAVDLCASLNAVLDRVGVSRFIRPTAPAVHSGSEKDAKGLDEVYRLESELQMKLRNMSEHRNNALSPMARLPDDILRLIFSVPAYEKWPGWPQYALKVSSVCRRWRAVGVETAVLWAGAFFPMDRALQARGSTPSYKWPHPRYDSEAYAAVTQMEALFFARSKEAPVSATFTIAAEAAALSFIRSCSGRAESLKLEVDSSADAIQWFSPCISATKSVLRKLDLSFTRSQQTGVLAPKRLEHSAADFLMTEIPRLTDVTISDMPLPTHTNTTYRALSSCKKLQFTAYRSCLVDGIALLLQSCPILEELHIKLYEAPSATPTRDFGGRILLSELKRLTIGGRGEALRTLLSLMKAPQLSRIELCWAAYFSDPDDGITQSVIDFLQVSAAPVRLILAGGGITSTSTAQILRYIPTLQEIIFVPKSESSLAYTALLQAMAAPTGEGEKPAFQSLERLYLPEWIPTVEEFDVLRRFVEDRNARSVDLSVTPIRRIMLGAQPEQSQPLPGRMEERLAEEVEELIIKAGPYDARRWKFDKRRKTWRRLRWT